uniref:Apple domain-containing protein n=1 Tax=Syphacia muris TaxID=451379 RepID=A0A0N5A8Y8_9BILA
MNIQLVLFAVAITALAAGSSIGFRKHKVEELCARMHNNTAFIGVQPFARLLVDSASKCQKSCMELHPKCTAVVFYYVYGEKVNHICFLFDRNSVNENVALVPEKPKNANDVIRALEIVSNCHEFDPFPPLPDPFVVSSDTVGRDKRGTLLSIGYHKPIQATGPWSRWSPCNHANSQIRSQTCDYGRKIEKRQCAPKYPQQSSPIYAPAESAPPSTPYPPYGYNHPSAYSYAFIYL